MKLRNIVAVLLITGAFAGCDKAPTQSKAANEQVAVQSAMKKIDYVQVEVKEDQLEDELVVREFFWYGCPHCADASESLVKAKDSLKSKRKVRWEMTPVPANNIWAIGARFYFVAEKAGLSDAQHLDIFNAIKRKDIDPTSKESFLAYAAKIGLDATTMKANWDSKDTDEKMKKAMIMSEIYLVEGTPSVGVAGKATVTPGTFKVESKQLGSSVESFIEKEFPKK